MKKLVALLLTFLLVLTGCSGIKVTKIDDDNDTDAIKFSEEYTAVPEDNVYKYATINNVTDTIKSGSGIIFLGFPTCPWCKEAAPVLNEVAKSKDVKEIFYYNIKEIRANNTKEYKELVSLLSDFLTTDENGDKRIYAPTVVFVQNGVVKGIHIATVDGHDAHDAHERTMTDDEKAQLKQIYSDLIDQVYNDECDC